MIEGPSVEFVSVTVEQTWKVITLMRMSAMTLMRLSMITHTGFKFRFKYVMSILIVCKKHMRENEGLRSEGKEAFGMVTTSPVLNSLQQIASGK